MLWRIRSLAPWIASRAGVTIGSAWSAIWTFPSVIGLAMVIAWAAEVSQYFISQGMALAILAWLQTLPEFMVEAVIAWHQDVSLMTANFTGSLRLLVGLGWPLIYVVAAISNRRRGNGPLREIKLDENHCIEVMGLFFPILYFFRIYFKATITLVDSGILIFFYVAYIAILSRMPPEEEPEPSEQPYIPRKILGFSPRLRMATIVSMFTGGAVGLYMVADSFLSSMLGVATAMGVSYFIFVQWVAPFLSEFPEKVSAVYWARRDKMSSMAVMNMVSSNINQWTMLVAMIPIVYSVSKGQPSFIPLDESHRMEILLTIAQSTLGFLLLCDMRFRWYEAIVMFGSWLAQFLVPHLREEVTIFYFGWVVVHLIMVIAGKRKLDAFHLIPKILGKKPNREA